jgi:alkylated DNA repair protein (DNA oxidative demethylase)
MDTLFPREPVVIRPGAVHQPDWLSIEEQRYWLERCREWARPPAGLRTPHMPDGKSLSIRSVCLGWHWYPYAYSRTVDDGDGAPVKPLPADLEDLARRAVHAAADLLRKKDVPELSAAADALGASAFRPDASIVNFYGPEATLGLHQDGAETCGSPVVTLSLGNDCLFRLGNNERPARPWHDLRLHSGDLLVFGGPARPAYHGVVRVHGGTAPPELGMKRGRISMTVRQTGLSEPPVTPTAVSAGRHRR